MRVKYTCPRCTYETDRKSNMWNHLYARNKPCPTTKSSIVLTEQIKKHIMENRIYRQENTSETTTDPVTKLTLYFQSKNIKSVNVDKYLKEMFAKRSHRLATNKMIDFSMNFDDMMEIVDDVTTMCAEKICIVYDEQLHKLKFFTCGEWKSRLFDVGVKYLMRKIQEYYFDHYERYLLQKITDASSAFDKTVIAEHLEAYYGFIAGFDVPPLVAAKSDGQILFDSDRDSSYSIQDTWYPKYKKAKETTKKNVIVHDIIKRNIRNNVFELDKKLSECRENLI